MSIHQQNQQSAQAFLWDPWKHFGIREFGRDLAKAIGEYQVKWNIYAEGQCGPQTLRRMDADPDMDFTLDDALGPVVKKRKPTKAQLTDNILVGGELKPIPWPKVFTAGEEGALVLTKGFSRYDYREKLKGEKKPRPDAPLLWKERDAPMVITHWDVCLDARRCRDILALAGISSHFVIDWDGVIYQMVDVRHAAWHCRKLNRKAIGVDFNSPVLMHYQDRVAKLKQPERPVVSGPRIMGWRPKPFLGLHQVQLDAYAALLAGLAEHAGIPLEGPFSEDPDNLRRMDAHQARKARGVFHHAEVQKGKWDVAGLDIGVELERARALAA